MKHSHTPVKTVTFVLFLSIFMLSGSLLMGLSGRRIGIDPGHGDGDNPGVYIAEGTWVRDGGFRARHHLENHGAIVTMTRTGTSDPALSTRVNILNSNNCERSISIHSNAASSAAVGMESYYCSLNPASSTSQTLADQLRLRSLSMVHNANRGTKECLDAGRGFHFTIIRTTNHATALPEYYFHTNSWENYNLHYFGEGRENIARSLYAAVCDHFNLTPAFSDPMIGPELWVKTTADPSLNLRSGPGTDHSIIKGIPYQSEAIILDHEENGIYRTNNYWWYVEVYECGTRGWLAQYFLETTDSPECVVTTPDPLSGPTDGKTHQLYTYSTGGSTCSCGGNVEYYYNWGDGTGEGWTSNTSASKTWTESGIYDIRTRARCVQTEIQSPASDWTTVTMHYLDSIEIIGPSTLRPGESYQFECRAYFNDGTSSMVTPEWSIVKPIETEVILEDRFQYGSQSAFESAWPASGTSLQFVSGENRPGGTGGSVLQDNTARANILDLDDSYHGTDSEPLTLEFWMNDTDTSLQNARHFVSLAAWADGSWGEGELENLIAFGVYTSPENNEYYKARILSGSSAEDAQGWLNTTGTRSQGWQKVTIEILSDTMRFYLNDDLVLEDNYTAPATGWNTIRLGSALTSGNDLSIGYDDVSLYRKTEVSEGYPDILSDGTIHTEDYEGEFTLSALYEEGPTSIEELLEFIIHLRTNVNNWSIFH